MRAAVLLAAGQVAVVDDWPEPTCGPEEVVVAIHGVGVCGSDLAVVRGERAVPRLPWVLGHEATGQIVEVGAAVTGRERGQHVVIEPNFCCLTCSHCRAGATATCQQRRVCGMSEPGLLAERVAVPARFTWPVPARWPVEDRVCVEPLAVAMTAVDRIGVATGEPALVIGAGAQGLLACLALQRRGAVPFAVDPHPGRMALAGELGVRDGRVPDAPTRFPVVLETSGAPEGVASAVSRAAPDGRLALIGQSREPARLSTFDLVQRRLTVRGCLIYDHPGGFASTIHALSTEPLAPGRVMGGRFSLSAASRAFCEAGTIAGKSWITLTGEGETPR